MLPQTNPGEDTPQETQATSVKSTSESSFLEPDADTIVKLHFEKHDEVDCNSIAPRLHEDLQHGSRLASGAQEDHAPPEREIVAFARGDPANPYNWSLAKKMYVVVTSIVLVMNSTIGSSLPSGAAAETKAYFNLDNDELLVLPISMYLVGYVMGPLVFAPLSESYGRKWVVLSTFIVFIVFNLGCALAPTFAGLAVMRLLVGIGASTPISVIGGIFADIYNTPKARGRAMMTFMAATTWGPLVGPVIAGFISVVSWRWTYWVMLIVAGVTFPFVLFMPETYGPVLLKRKAQRLRRERNDPKIVAPIELVEQSWQEFASVVLLRPIRMFLFEWIVLFSCLYLAVVYAVFYIFLQVYPIIFQGIYSFNAGEEGLTFLPIGVGAVIAGMLCLWWEHHLSNIRSRSPPPAWALQEEYYRLPTGCLGAQLFPISLFWLGWTARPGIHWIVPTLSALPFGIGYLTCFMSLINYMVDSYEIYAASAMGAASCSRSLFGVVIPFAAQPMYQRLGVAWACSLLGFICLAMGVVPFLFIKYGERIRANSKWCQELKRKKAEEEEKVRRLEEEQIRTLHVIDDPEKQI